MGTPTVNDLDGLLSSLNQLKPPGASKNKIATITTLCVTNIQVCRRSPGHRALRVLQSLLFTENCPTKTSFTQSTDTLSQNESSIVQSFYRALKKAPSTHKLGALYVIDSVVRQWIEKAKSSGQDLSIEGRGEPGTYPAAVKRVTELMPALFDDIMKGIPEDQKPKLANMITIWERGNTFPAKLLAEFKTKVSVAPSQSAAATPVNASGMSAPAPPQHQPVQQTSAGIFMAPVPTKPVHTPTGMPPRQLYDQGLLPGRMAPGQTNGASNHPNQSTPAQSFPPAQQQQQQQQAPQAAPANDVNSILASLARAAPPAQQAPSFPPAPQAVAPVSAPPQNQLPPQWAGMFGQQQQPGGPPPMPYGFPPSSAPPSQQPAYPPPPQFAGYPPQPPPSIPQQYSVAPPPYMAPPPQADPLAPLRGFLPENIINDNQKLIPALQLLQDLQKDGIPPDKWGPVLKAFEEQYQPPQPAPPAYGAQSDYGRNRGRSRSPDRGNRGGRGSPVYGSYDPETARRQAEENNRGGNNNNGGGGRGRYRQRSPMRDSPAHGGMNGGGHGMQPKIIGYDGSLPPDNIKVLSRTLFVGGANGSQQEIQELFERFGRVQTCIANRDKRHAFVKMTTRTHALSAKSNMEELQSRNDREAMNIARQTKWGVGFGPRECCDYAKGESIIPIHKLTEADLKWLLTAEYGGTGGKQLEGGMVLEEPDIEIGAGVSSKAMSKRVGPDNAPAPKRQREGRHGKHNKGGNRDGGHGGASQDYGSYSGATGGPPPQYGYMARPEPVAVATPPAVPGFGFSLGGLGIPPTSGSNPYR